MVNKLVLHEDYFKLPVIYKFKKGQTVYVDGDYFDIANEPSWSKEVLKVNPRYVILPGLIKETNIFKKNTLKTFDIRISLSSLWDLIPFSFNVLFPFFIASKIFINSP